MNRKSKIRKMYFIQLQLNAVIGILGLKIPAKIHTLNAE